MRLGDGMEISSTQSPSRISSPNLTDVIKNILIPAVDSVGWNKNILTSVRLGDQREHFFLYLEGTNKNINFFKTPDLIPATRTKEIDPDPLENFFYPDPITDPEP